MWVLPGFGADRGGWLGPRGVNVESDLKGKGPNAVKKFLLLGDSD